jgi:hypothetical protein
MYRQPCALVFLLAAINRAIHQRHWLCRKNRRRGVLFFFHIGCHHRKPCIHSPWITLSIAEGRDEEVVVIKRRRRGGIGGEEVDEYLASLGRQRRRGGEEKTKKYCELVGNALEPGTALLASIAPMVVQ